MHGHILVFFYTFWSNHKASARRKGLIFGVKSDIAHSITSIPVSLIYTLIAVFFRFCCNPEDDSSVNCSLNASTYDGYSLQMQDTIPDWLICDGQSTTLLSNVYQLWCRNLVNDSEPFGKISVEEHLVSFLLCRLHCANDLEDVRFSCTGHPWM